MKNDEIPKEFYDAVEKAARDITGKWPDLEWEDTRQDMWVELLEDRVYLYKVVVTDNPGPMLRKLASRVVSEQFEYGQLFKGKKEYGTKRVRSMLEAGVITNYEVATVSESTDLSLAMLDLKKFNPDYFEVIKQSFVNGVIYDDTKKVTRSVDRLTDLMNIGVAKKTRGHEGPGGRVGISNSRALYITAENNEANYLLTHTR